MDFIVKEFDGLKFICGYLITLCSIILVLIIYKTGRASKSFVWAWGVTQNHNRLMIIFFQKSRQSSTHNKVILQPQKNYQIIL